METQISEWSADLEFSGKFATFDKSHGIFREIGKSGKNRRNLTVQNECCIIFFSTVSINPVNGAYKKQPVLKSHIMCSWFYPVNALTMNVILKKSIYLQIYQIGSLWGLISR